MVIYRSTRPQSELMRYTDKTLPLFFETDLGQARHQMQSILDVWSSLITKHDTNLAEIEGRGLCGDRMRGLPPKRRPFRPMARMQGIVNFERRFFP